MEAFIPTDIFPLCSEALVSLEGIRASDAVYLGWGALEFFAPPGWLFSPFPACYGGDRKQMGHMLRRNKEQDQGMNRRCCCPWEGGARMGS